MKLIARIMLVQGVVLLLYAVVQWYTRHDDAVARSAREQAFFWAQRNAVILANSDKVNDRHMWQELVRDRDQYFFQMDRPATNEGTVGTAFLLGLMLVIQGALLLTLAGGLPAGAAVLRVAKTWHVFLSGPRFVMPREADVALRCVLLLVLSCAFYSYFYESTFSQMELHHIERDTLIRLDEMAQCARVDITAIALFVIGCLLLVKHRSWGVRVVVAIIIMSVVGMCLPVLA